MSDLSSITATPNTVDIRHPGTAEPVGLKVTLREQDSEEVKKVRRRITNEQLKMRNKTMTAERLEANGIELIIAAVDKLEWAPDVDWKGEKLEASPENLRRLLKEAPWIKKQIDEAIGDEAAFFQS